jgi:GNAT superfamily N-acetyltransferase
VQAILIEPATEADVPALLALIRALADYERLGDHVAATAGDLRATLFGARPAAEAALAKVDGQPVGFALWFQTYSTFLGRPGLYLEDIFVSPDYRRRGIGRRLLTYVAHLAVERRCGRLEWSVLDWNAPAIEFYRSMGAVAMDAWTVYRLAGAALEGAAAGVAGFSGNSETST